MRGRHADLKVIEVDFKPSASPPSCQSLQKRHDDEECIAIEER